MMTNEDLLIEYQKNPSQEIRNQVVEQNVALVQQIARNVHVKLTSEVSHDDLFSSGVIGLMECIDRYDPSLGIKFSTFAYRRIFGAIIDDLRAFDEVSRHVRTTAKQSKEYTAECEALGYVPSDEEIAEHIGVPVQKYRKDMALASQKASLDFAVSNPTDDGDETSLAGILEPLLSLSLDSNDFRELARHVADAIAERPEREQAILWLYYYEGETIGQIGKLFDVVEGSIHQYWCKSLSIIREQTIGVN